MTCETIRPRLAGYLDGTLPEAGAVSRAVAAEHVAMCSECRSELETYRKLQQLLNRAERVAPPADLAVNIRIAAAKAREQVSLADRWRRLRDRASLVLENILQPLALPATGGFVAALFVFAVVLPFYAHVEPLGPGSDALPSALFQPARIEALAGFSVSALDEKKADNLLVEATVGVDGSIVDYRILSGPDNVKIRRQLDQLLMFSRFRPSMSFGRPMSGGRVIMSFSAVNIQG